MGEKGIKAAEPLFYESKDSHLSICLSKCLLSNTVVLTIKGFRLWVTGEDVQGWGNNRRADDNDVDLSRANFEKMKLMGGKRKRLIGWDIVEEQW